MTNEHRKYLKNFARCELCGSPKSLELHHIIPTVFGGPDVIDNWIAICNVCHAKLTPRRLLINKGLTKFFNPVHDFYKAIYDATQEAMSGYVIDGYGLDTDYVLDTFDDIFCNDKNPVEARYLSSRYKKEE